MKSLRPFEAFAVRYVHDGRNEEFLNIGVIMMARSHDFARARFLSKWGRISSAFTSAELPYLRKIAKAFAQRIDEWNTEVAGQRKIFDPGLDAGLEAILRQVLDPSEGAIRLSPSIRGITADPELTFNELYQRFVPEPAEDDRRKRDDSDVWTDFARRLTDPALTRRLESCTLQTPHYSHQFDHSWKNGHTNIAQPISFDLLDDHRIIEKATSWVGKVKALRPHSLHQASLYLLLGLPPDSGLLRLKEAAQNAIHILRDNLEDEAILVEESKSHQLADKIANDLAAHES